MRGVWYGLMFSALLWVLIGVGVHYGLEVL